MTRYTTVGSVRGRCSHAHRSLDTALACIDRDHRGCQRQGGYSDRRVMRLVDGVVEELSQDEHEYTLSVEQEAN